jgi:3-methyladenine DNA glycosylase AlkC
MDEDAQTSEPEEQKGGGSLLELLRFDQQPNETVRDLERASCRESCPQQVGLTHTRQQEKVCAHAT